MKSYVISPSTLDQTSCMQKFMYEKIVEAAPVQKPSFLSGGDLIHIMLASFYREKMKGELTYMQRVEKAIEAGRLYIVNSDLEVEEGEEVFIDAFRQYCEFNINDPYVPVAVEQVVVETLHEQPDTDEEEGYRVILQMIVDIIFENPQGHILWTDHKTRKRNEDAVPLSNQFPAYALISGHNRSLRNNIGLQKTVPPEKKFTRDMFFYPRGVLEWWRTSAVERTLWLNQCIKDSHYPPDFTKCRDYGKCWFIDVCMQSPENREAFINANFVRRKRRHSIYEHGDKK